MEGQLNWSSRPRIALRESYKSVVMLTRPAAFGKPDSRHGRQAVNPIFFEQSSAGYSYVPNNTPARFG